MEIGTIYFAKTFEGVKNMLERSNEIFYTFFLLVETCANLYNARKDRRINVEE